MEPVSATASLIALIEAAAVIGGAIVQLCLNVHGAPREISRVKSHLCIIKSELELLRILYSDQEIAVFLTSMGAQQLLTDAFQDAEKTIGEIHDACQRRRGQLGAHRLQWALLDRKTVGRLRGDLQHTESSLKTVLQILAIRQSSEIFSSVSQLSAGQQKMAAEVASIKKELKAAGRQPTALPWPEKIDTGLPIGSPPTHRTARSKRISDPFFSSLRESLSSMWNNEAATYSLALRTKVPFVNHAFVADFTVRQWTSSWWNLSLLSGTLGWKNVVPEDANIMTACQQGDAREVRNLFCNKLASPNDMTLSNSTPLRYAIESGSVEVVDLLLREGADVNWTFGQFQTSPLDWALQQRKLNIVRLLLARKASLDHVSAHGWTPLFYIWGNPHADTPTREEPCDDFIKLLTTSWDYASGELDDTDVQGWTPLHRAAAFGNPTDIALLIRLGASVRRCVPPLQWY